MQTHRKKRIELIVESSLVDRLVAEIEAAGASGYTTHPVIGGKGHHGTWQELGITPGAGMLTIVVIASPELADRLVPALYAQMTDFSGVILMSDVEVIRSAHFS
jgi:PII-like signaling protein